MPAGEQGYFTKNRKEDPKFHREMSMFILHFDTDWLLKTEKMNTEKVMQTLKEAGKPMKAGEIATASGLEKKEVDNAMKVLKAEGAIVSPKFCYWEPK